MDAQTNQDTQIQDTVAQTTDTNTDVTEAELRASAIAAAKAEEKPVEAPQAPTEPPATEQKESGGLDAKRLALQVARLEKQIRDHKSTSDKTKADYDALINRLKDPEQRYALLEEHGGDYTDWTNRIVAGEKPQRDQRDVKLDQLEQTIQQLQSQLEQRQADEQKATQEQSQAKAHAYAKDYLETNKEKYPILHAMGRGDLLVNEAIARSKEGLPVNDDEIASEIEKAAFDKIKTELSALVKLDAFASVLSELGFSKSAQHVPETEQTQRDKDTGYQNQTLTNDLSGQPSSGFDYSKATDDEVTEYARKRASEAVAAERRRQNS